MREFMQILLFILYVTPSFQTAISQNCMQFVASTCDGQNNPLRLMPIDPSTQGLPGKDGARGETGPQGPKGEPGKAAKDHTLKITELENDIGNLKSKSYLAEKKLDKLVSDYANLQSEVVSLQSAERLKKRRYIIRRTPRKGTFDEARQMCVEMGGDLLQKCLSTVVNGVSYARQIRTLLNLDRNLIALWFGIDDREGRWKYVSGEYLYGHFDDGYDLLYFWDGGQPQHNAEHCGGYYVRANSLHDFECHLHFYGICEVPI